jgi:drug/metabolite transporter (DMT)-like permease
VVVFIAIVPLLIVGVNLFFGVRPGRLELAGIGLGLAGVVMLTRGQGFQSSPRGLAYIVTACTCWSVGSVLSQRKLPLAPGAMGFASEMLAGGVVVIAVALLQGESLGWPPEPLAAWAWVYLVVFGSLLAFNAYMVLLARTTAGLAASYTFVNPIIALGLGIAFGGETVTPFEWLAAGVILAGVVLLLVRPASATRS